MKVAIRSRCVEARRDHHQPASADPTAAWSIPSVSSTNQVRATIDVLATCRTRSAGRRALSRRGDSREKTSLNSTPFGQGAGYAPAQL